jgi:hypothetical protein
LVFLDSRWSFSLKLWAEYDKLMVEAEEWVEEPVVEVS